MKNFKLQIVILCAVILTCGSFINIQKNAKPANAPDVCFTTFLDNLKTLGAIVYVPQFKMEKAKELGLIPVKNNSNSSSEAVDLLSVYDQVGPVLNKSDQCSIKVQATFGDMQLLILVDKSNSDKLAPFGLQKIASKINDQDIKLDKKHSKDEYFLLQVGNKEIRYNPVTWN